MKKIFQNVLARALCFLVLGTLLVAFSGNVSEWMVRICGMVFIIPGCVSLVSHFRHDVNNRQVMLYPVIAVGSILFGLVQMVWPGLFTDVLRYVLAAILILAAVTQFYTLWNIWRNGMRFNGLFYLVPTLELALSLYVILHEKMPSQNALSNILIGSGFLVYALFELWTIWLVKHAHPVSASTEIQKP